MTRTLLDRERAYAEWAPSYPPSAHNALMRIEQAAMLRLMPSVAGLDVLDAGSGTGRYARLAQENGARQVIQLDASAAMLEHGVYIGASIRGVLSHLPFRNESFDVVLSGLVLPDVRDIGPVLSEWHRVLRPGGVLVYSTLHPDGERLGWTRTFETAAGDWALPAYWHAVVDQRQACADAGLAIECVDEPAIDHGHPVAFIVRARRTGEQRCGESRR